MADDEIKKVSGRPGPDMPYKSEDDFLAALSRGRKGAVDDPSMDEMRLNRRVAQRRLASQAGVAGGMGGGGMADFQFATGRPRDPMFYWRQNNLPYDVAKPEELKRLRALCRMIYLTHSMLASAIDIYSKYPLTGMEFTCKDKALTEFYTDLMFDQLEYEEFLIDLLREYWITGEAWPLGSFNETLGVWEDDELLHPDDVEVRRSPFLREPRLYMRLPETLRNIIDRREPAWEFEALMRSYPELKNFSSQDALMPVSNILLKQIKFKADTFHPRGIPIMLRTIRPVMQEEMLNAAQDAIADRLYTPLILARLGASATDLGTTQPWIPTEDDRADFMDSLDAALAADFRVLVHHFALQLDSVFGRENMPNLDPDFDRLAEKQLQAFGLSKTMLSGAGQGETYAADAMNRDLVSQLLTTAQRRVKKFVRDRMLVVAEAQEHFDYDIRGGKRYPIMEEVLEVDEESGEQRIVEQPKLLVPDLQIRAMNMSDEKDMRQFIEALRSTGVPISDKTRLVNIPIDLEDEREAMKQEAIDKAVAAQETRKAVYLALRDKNLPIPDDLKADFEPKASDAPSKQQQAAPEVPLPSIGNQEEAPTMALVPVPGDYQAQQPPPEGGEGPTDPDVVVTTLPRNKALDPGRTRPPESDEQRARMAKPAKVTMPKVAGFDLTVGLPIPLVEMETVEIDEGAGRLISGPKHIGSRRYSGVSRDVPLDDDPEPQEGAI